MSTEKARMVPVLCTVQNFTEAAVVLQTYNEDDAASDALTFTVPMSLAILQTIESWANRGNTVSPQIRASRMTGEQQADAMLSDIAIAWIPQWKVDDLGVKTMEPEAEHDI